MMMNWSNITLGQYLQFKKKSLGASDPASELQGTIEIVRFWSGKSIDEISSMTLEAFAALQAKFSFLSEPNLGFDRFMADNYDPSCEAIIIDNTAYLKPKSLPQIITGKPQMLKGEKVGDYLDAMQLYKIFDSPETDILEALPYIAALFWRMPNEESPKHPQVLREAWLTERAGTMKQMSMDYAWQVYFFFMSQQMLSLKLFLTYIATAADLEEIQSQKLMLTSKQKRGQSQFLRSMATIQ